MDPKLQEGLLRLVAMFGVLGVGILVALATKSLWVLVAAIVASIIAPWVVRLLIRRRQS